MAPEAPPERCGEGQVVQADWHVRSRFQVVDAQRAAEDLEAGVEQAGVEGIAVSLPRSGQTQPSQRLSRLAPEFLDPLEGRAQLQPAGANQFIERRHNFQVGGCVFLELLQGNWGAE